MCVCLCVCARVCAHMQGGHYDLPERIRNSGKDQILLALILPGAVALGDYLLNVGRNERC